MMRGTTLDDPVTVEQVPDLKSSQHELQEYLDAKNVYNIFDFLLKELLTKRPANPYEHMLKCLRTEHASGPIKVIVVGPAGVGRSKIAKRIADVFKLEFVSAGELSRNAGLLNDEAMADELEVAKLVVEKLKKIDSELKGLVLDGFPRTRLQTSFLKENGVVPAHVLLLQAPEEYIHDRNRASGRLDEELLDRRLRLHCGHISMALEVYNDRITVISAEADDDEIVQDMSRIICKAPRSRGPRPPPRVVVLCPTGVRSPELARNLAFRFGCVYVDAADWEADKDDLELLKRCGKCVLPQQEVWAKEPLGIVGGRLRQEDCAKDGWVLVGFPASADEAAKLQEDFRLCPNRIIVLDCPKSHAGKPREEPAGVGKTHEQFLKTLPAILNAFGKDSRCTVLSADLPETHIFKDMVDFVERPLPFSLP